MPANSPVNVCLNLPADVDVGFGGHWWALATPGRYWRTLAGTGYRWRALMGPAVVSSFVTDWDGRTRPQCTLRRGMRPESKRHPDSPLQTRDGDILKIGIDGYFCSLFGV
jgi:hypothetical protein